jgi:hypothetical protein
MKRIRTKLLFATCLLAMAGCMKDDVEIDEFKYTRMPNLAAPVFYANVDYNGIFKHLAKNKPQNNAKVEFDNDGLIYLTYKKNYDVSWNSVADINDIYWSNNQLFPTVAGKKVSQRVSDQIKMNADDSQRFDTLIISKSTMTVKAAKLDVDGNGTMTFPEMTKNGKALEVKWKLNEGTEQTIDVAGYKIVPKHSTGTSYMTNNIVLEGTASASSTTSHLNIEMTMTDIVPQVIFGYFGTKNALNRQSVMNINFFQSHEFPDEVEFTGAFINLDVNNWTGTPFNLKMDDRFIVKSNKDSLPVSLLKDNPLYIEQIDYTDYRADGKYNPKHNYFLIDTTNSNLNAILNCSPNSYDYTLEITTNPNGEQSENFLTEESKLLADVQLYIPFWLKITDLTREDTIDFDLNNIILDADNAKYVDSITLYFDFDNGFPITLWSQAYLVDEKNMVVDSLFNGREQLWNTPQLDQNKRVSKWTATHSRVTMDNEKIVDCSKKNVKKIILHTGISTTGAKTNQYLKFYKEYGLTMNLSFEVLSKK